jgi:cytochrome c oxidase cbb3-type subunit 1
MLSIKTINALSHNTDWTIGHVHSGALGWVAMVSIGAMYHLIPLLYGRNQGQMYSTRLINLHFWLATLGTVLYIASMWVNGLLQGLMWRATSVDGTLTYSFAESVEASYPGYYARFLGGAIFLLGMFIMAFNVYKTARGEKSQEAATTATPLVNPEGTA